jgi:hypothetical protein
VLADERFNAVSQRQQVAGSSVRVVYLVFLWGNWGYVAALISKALISLRVGFHGMSEFFEPKLGHITNLVNKTGIPINILVMVDAA